MFYEIAYHPIAGLPVIFYLGVITLICLFMTVSIVMMNKRGYHALPMRWHFTFGKITLILGLIHGLLGALVYLP